MLVLDANILIRAVLGSRVLSLLRKYAGQVEFLAPNTAFEEAHESLPEILERRKVPVVPAMVILDQLAGLVQTVDTETYQSLKYLARQRIAHRDEDDWPVLAAALAPNRGIDVLHSSPGSSCHSISVFKSMKHAEQTQSRPAPCSCRTVVV